MKNIVVLIMFLLIVSCSPLKKYKGKDQLFKPQIEALEQLKDHINNHTKYHILYHEGIRNDKWHGKNIHFSKELHNKKNVHLEFIHKSTKELRDNGRLKQIFNDVVYS